jgi:polar amino acid transport system substrate-binding protein
MDLNLNSDSQWLQNKSRRRAITRHSPRKATQHMNKASYLALVLLFVIYPSSADNNPVIHIVTEHLPPYQIEDENKNLSGFAVDIIRETMARSHYAYSLKSYPWVRSYKLAQIKENHCIFSIARLKSREDLFKWVGPISKVNNTAMWGLKGQRFEINKLEDAKNYTIAVNRDDIAHIGLLERGFIEGINLYVLDDSKSLINILITRPEINLIVADDTTISFRAELSGVNIAKLQKVHDIKDLPLNFFFACSPHTADKVIQHLAIKLASIYKDGTYERIWAKWKSKLIKVP